MKAFKDLSRTKQMKMLHDTIAHQGQIIASFLQICDPICQYWKAIEEETDDTLVLLAEKSKVEGGEPTVVLALNLRIVEDFCTKLKIHLSGGQVEDNSE